MYQLLESRVLTKGTFGGYTEKDLSSTRLIDIFNLYGAAIVYVYDNVNDDNGWIDLYSLPVTVRSSVQTLTQYLYLASGLTVLTDDPFGVRGDNYVRFLFAQAYGFYITGSNNAFSIGESLLPDQKVDIIMTKTGITDYTSINNYALFSANGLFYRTWAQDSTGILMFGAGKAASKVNDNRVGIWDFSNIGAVSTYPITADMIQGGGTSTPLKNGFFLESPVTLSGKTIGIVIAGKLHLLDKALSIVGEKRIRINANNLNFVDLYYDVFETLDMSSIGLTASVNFDDQFVMAQFNSDATITNFMTHAQTFLVVIESTNLVREDLPLKNIWLPGRYLSPTTTRPDLPIKIGNGYFAEYNLLEFDDYWVVTLPHYLQENRFFETTAQSDIGIMRDTLYGYNPRRRNAAHQVLIKKVAST